MKKQTAAFVDIALLIQLGEDLLAGLHMVVIGGADKAVVADIQQLPQILDGGHDLVHILFGGDAGIGSLILDLLAVLIGAGQEHDVVALHPLEAGQRIAGHGGVAVADVQLIAGVVDGGGDVKCLVLTHGDMLFLSIVAVSQKSSRPAGCAGQGRELNFRGTTLLRRALASGALWAGA